MKLLILVLVPSLFAVAARAETCTYSLEKNSVRVGWTAFKTSAKTPVSGSFKSADVKGKFKAKSLAKLLEGLRVTVKRESSDSGNPTRDKTLAEYFFQKLSPKAITGGVKNVSESDKTFMLALSFNGQKADVPMTYTFDAEMLKSKGSMDLPTLGAQEALDSLHTQCADLHKGADGVSKTWPDVEIHVDAKIVSACK